MTAQTTPHMKQTVTILCLCASVVACEQPSQPTADDGADQAQQAAADEQEPPPPAGTLERKLHDKAAKFAADMHPTAPAFGGELEEGNRRDQLVVLRFGRCYRFIGVGGPEVEDLDMILFDPDNVQVQRDFGEDPYPVLGMRSEICPQQNGAYRMQVGMFKGRGSYLARAYEHGP